MIDDAVYEFDLDREIEMTPDFRILSDFKIFEAVVKPRYSRFLKCQTNDAAYRSNGGGSLPPRPKPVQGDLRNLPEALRQLTLPCHRQWVVWKFTFKSDAKPGKEWTKPPFNPRSPNHNAKNNDSSTWATYGDALNVIVTHTEFKEFGGIGYNIFHSILAVFDLDDCRNLETGEILPWALDLISKAKTYAEITPSGTGLRIIGLTSDDSQRVQRKQPIPDTTSSLESYRKCERYITITGLQVEGSPNELVNIDAVMDDMIAALDKGKGKTGDKDTHDGFEFRRQKVDVDALDLSKLGSLELDVRETMKRGCVQGDSFKGDRSRAVFYVACKLVGIGIEQSIIVNILLDPTYGISEHVLEQKNPLRAARKTVQDAINVRGQAVHSFDSIMAAIVDAPEREALTILCRLVPLANLNKGEENELIKFVGKRFGGVAAARTELKKAFKKYHREKAKEQKEKQKTTFAFGEMPIPASHVDTKLKDFIAYMPTHEYYYVPTRDMWPTGSVNSQIPAIAINDDEEIAPSVWLDQHRHIEQMTWNPGFPMIIKNRLIKDGGWIEKPGDAVFNLYIPPTIVLGDASKAGPWVDLYHLVYPIEADHQIKWFACRAQHPEIKINHGLVMAGTPGIGKDTLLEGVKHTVGHWNFQEISPERLKDEFNPYIRSVILRISEARDLGDIDLFAMHEKTKTLNASPPDVLPCNEKYLRQHPIANVTGLVYTTNHRTGGLYIPSDDRRHHVAWSLKTKEDFETEFWNNFWNWYANGGIGHVAAYLNTLDISSFDPKAPPPKTEAWHAMVDASMPTEQGELADVVEDIGDPDALTLLMLASGAKPNLQRWLMDRKNGKLIPHRLEKLGYVRVRNEGDKRDGLWCVTYYHYNEQTSYTGAKKKKRQAIYVKKSLKTIQEQADAALALTKKDQPLSLDFDFDGF